MLNQHDLIDIFRTLDPTSGEDIFFLSAYESFTGINPKLDHEISPDSFKKIKIRIFYLIKVALNKKSIPER